jgi:hypothetical protein
MTDRKRARGRQHRFEIGKAVHHDGQRGHQLLALLGHVGWKHRLDLWRDLEQAIIEDRGGLIGDRRDLGEALLHEFDLVGCHVSLLFLNPSPRKRDEGNKEPRRL